MQLHEWCRRVSLENELKDRSTEAPINITYNTTGAETTAELTDDDIQLLHQQHGVPVTEAKEVTEVSLTVSQGGRCGTYRKFSLSKNSRHSSVVATTSDEPIIYGMVLTVLKYHNNFFVKCLRLQAAAATRARFVHSLLTHDVQIISVNGMSAPKIYCKTIADGRVYFDIINPVTN